MRDPRLTKLAHLLVNYSASVRPGDLVLVKGSRGIGTDLVVARLKAEFA